MTREDNPTARDETATIADPSAEAAFDATEPVPQDGVEPAHQIVVDVDRGLPAAGERVGRYELLEVIGRGGMGVVFRARDPQLERPLAIKVVLPATADKRSQGRLLDEARAMAKLRHPAVVPVFDVGTTERGVYVVMPLLLGGTLREWATTARRSWREVLARYLIAGRGLAAAHAAGLVHRDFKPRNVLLGEDGEVMVADFGLAADAGATPASSDGATSQDGPRPITSIGGTPAYMAPEQASGEPIDGRADQFSFCVALWEGLHGQRPTEAATRAGGVLTSAALPEVPADRRGVPRWLLTAIARGWQAAPDRRWPTMAALLDHIERRLRRPRRIAAGAVGLALVGGAASVALLLSPSKALDPCPDPRPRLAAAWSPEHRARVEAAFLASGLPGAGATTARVLERLDAYAERWRIGAIETCRATHITRSESLDLFDRRQLCLERRLRSLEALSTTFAANPTPAFVARAEVAVADLPDIGDCARSEALLAVQPLPGSPERRAEIDRVERELDAIVAARRGGDPKAQLTRARSALATARTLEYGPVLVRALSATADAESDNGIGSDETLRELASVAAELHDDRAAADALVGMLQTLAARAKNAEGKALEPVAEAAVIRAGSPPMLRWQLEMGRGSRALRAQEYDVAFERFGKAVEVAPDDNQRTDASLNQAKATMARGDQAGALKLAEQVLRDVEAGRGREHPDAATILKFIGQIHAVRGDYARAEETARRALAIDEAVFGSDHPGLAINLKTLVHALIQTGRLAEARPYAEQAVRVAERSDDALKLASALDSLGGLAAKLGDIAAARPYFERALPLVENAIGKDKPFYVSIEVNYAEQLVRAKECADARPLLEHAATVGKQRPEVLPPVIFLLGRCDEQDGAIDAALANYARVAEVCARSRCEPQSMLAARMDHGELLYSSGKDRRRGLAMLRAVRADLEAKGMTSGVKDIDGWLAKHGLAK